MQIVTGLKKYNEESYGESPIAIISLVELYTDVCLSSSDFKE